MPLNEIGTVANNTSSTNFPLGLTQGTYKELVLDPSGAALMMDFYLKAMLAGKGYQVRAGTITTPLVGDVVITDTAAEFCVDPAASGMVLLPIDQFISIRLGTGTLHEYATKSVATASSAGTAFVPLPLIGGGVASGASARVQAAGSVTVTAELATTTRRHWSYSNPVAVGAGDGAAGADLQWHPRPAPPIVSGYCLYTQVAATGTGPSYYANLDWLEFTKASLGM